MGDVSGLGSGPDLPIFRRGSERTAEPTMFRKDRRYRHQHSTDIDIIVHGHVYGGSKYLRLKVHYFNRTYGGLVSLIHDNVMVQREDLWKWREVDL